MTKRNGHSNGASVGALIPGRTEAAKQLDALLLNEHVRDMTNNLMITRDAFMTGLLDPRRDLDSECGFPKDPIPLELYQGLFDRHPVAYRVLTAMDEEAWKETLEIYEDEDPEVETPFEYGVKHLGDNLEVEEENYYEDQDGVSNPLWQYVKQWSQEAGVGQYGVMLLGFDDKKQSLRDPLKKGSAKNLLFIRTFSETEAQVASWETRPDHPRYGRPRSYNLYTYNSTNRVTRGQAPVLDSLQNVHWTRCLHLAKDPGSNRYLSKPGLRVVLNDILSLSKPLYGSGEGYWRAGLPTWLAKTDPKLGGSPRINRNRIRDQLEQWMNSLQKVLIANGWALESISGSVQDPKTFIDCHLDVIALKISMPKRILLGSERGELASSDDAKKWEATKSEYRKNTVMPKEVVPLINRNIYAGTVPAPKKSFYGSWTTGEHLTDQEKADVFVKKMQGLSVAVSGGVTTLIGEKGVLSEAGYTDEEADQLLEDAAEQEQEDREQALEDAANMPQPAPGTLPPGAPGQGGAVPPGPGAPPKPGFPPQKGKPNKGPAKPGKPAVPVKNKFCPTGVGGGIDPSCGKDAEGGGAGKGADTSGLKGSGTKDDPYKVGGNIKLAAQLLSEGHHVRLKQPDQVSTLLDKMHKMIWSAVEKGDKAPSFDLCKVSVKDTNLFCQDSLGIPRVQMPQMKGVAEPGSKAHAMGVDKKGEVDLSRAFIDHMQAQGIKTEQTDVRASHLRASQNEIVGTKIAKMVTEAKAGMRDLREKPIFVTKDNYVVDGHHHWAAIVGLGLGKGKDLKVPVYRLNTDIGTALSMANDYTKAMGIKPKAAVQNKKRKPKANSFCPTGEGGGIDPSCGGHAVVKGKDEDPIEALTKAHGRDVRTEGLAKPTVFYHVTDAPKAVSTGGLKMSEDPDSAYGLSGSEKDFYKGVYLSTQPQMVERGERLVQVTLPAGSKIDYDPENLVEKKHGGKVDPKYAASDAVIFRGHIPKSQIKVLKRVTSNSFCATGPGGGIDPSCSPGGSGGEGLHPPGAGLAHGGEAVEHVAHLFHGHAAALGMLGNTTSTIGSAVAALRVLGVNVGHAEHIAKEYVSDKVGRAVNKLPASLQTIVRATWAAARIGTAVAFTSYTASQAFAEKVAGERGYSKEEARRLRGFLSSFDVAAAKPIALTAGPTASFVPVASLSYLAYSTARDPSATLRAARRSLGELGQKVKGLVRNEDKMQALVDAIEAHGFDDRYIAILSVAVDATQDVDQAIAAANEAYDKE